MRKLLFPLLLVLLSGCASQPESPGQLNGLPVAEPVTTDSKNQVLLARLNDLLYLRELTRDQRAQLHYERGVLYDSMGLDGLAMLDFQQALKLKPDYAEAYNFVGIYQVQMGDYTGAFEALDAVLELSPNHPYAYLNRGIALYYGDRPELATEDLSLFYQQQPDDPYRVLWLYLAEQQVDSTQADQKLRQRLETMQSRPWATQLIQVYLGELSEEAFFQGISSGVTDNQELAERLCEGYFYLGKQHQLRGDLARAVLYFKLSLATNVNEFVEHRFSTLELRRMESEALQDEQLPANEA